MRDIGRRLFNIQPICKWDAPILKLWNTFTALRRRSVRPDLMSFGPFNQLRMSHGSIQYFQFNPLHPTADSIWPFKWSNSPIFGYTQEPGESKKQKKKKKKNWIINSEWTNSAIEIVVAFQRIRIPQFLWVNRFFTNTWITTFFFFFNFFFFALFSLMLLLLLLLLLLLRQIEETECGIGKCFRFAVCRSAGLHHK